MDVSGGLGWVLQNAIALIVVLLAFGLVIFVHELGHFSVAKWVGITVHEFALGFGPRIFGFKKGETEYNLRAFPFGGFVRMEGEDDPESDPNDPGSFLNKPVGAQIAVVGGGVFVNYMSALFVLLLVGFVWGIPDPLAGRVIASVEGGSVAEKAGLKPKDEILSVEGQKVRRFDEVVSAIQARPGQPTQVTLKRDGAEQTITLTPDTVDQGGKKIGRVGIRGGGSIVSFGFVPASSASEVFQMAGGWLVRITIMPFEIARQVFSKERSFSEVREGVGGPIGIGTMFFEIYSMGLPSILFFWAIINAAVGGFNILPIPALDGARLLFLGIGAIRGRPIDPRKEGMVHMIGLAVLLTVMVLVSIQDVSRLLRGVKFFS